MRPTHLMILGILVLIPVADAASISFAEPGEFDAAEGSLGAQWVLFVFKGASAADFTVASDVDTIGVNETIDRPLVYRDQQREISPHQSSSADAIVLPGGTTNLGFAGVHPSSLMIEGNLTVRFQGAIGAITNKPPGASLAMQGRPDDEMLQLYRPRALSETGLLVSGSSPQGTSIWLEGTASHLEWYAGNVACQATSCPRGGGPQKTTLAMPTGGYLESQKRSYESFDGGFVVSGYGTVDYLVLGGPSIDLQLQGSVRLPLASGGSCQSCVHVQDQTIFAEGALRLGEMRPGSSSGTIDATVSGDIERARLDESAIDPAILIGASSASLIVGTAAVVLAIKFLGSLLFTRVREPKALQHPKRMALYETIRARPGIPYNRLLATTGITSGTGRHHLNILVSLGFVQTKVIGNTLRHFPTGVSDVAQCRFALLNDNRLEGLVQLVRSQPGLTQAAILEAHIGESRSAIQYRISKLVEGGVIMARRDGRQVHYHYLPSGQAHEEGVAA